MNFTRAMLAEPVNDAVRDKRLALMVSDDRWFAQQKLDGHRCLMHIDGGRIAPVARSGALLNIKPYILNDFKQFLDTDIRWVFDGEYVDGHYFVFDLIKAGRFISTTTPLEQRLDSLDAIWGNSGLAEKPSVSLVNTARTTEAKGLLADKVQTAGGEGLVFKLSNSIYSAGRRSQAYRKVKFRKDVDCVVAAVGTDGKSNLTLSMWDGTKFVAVGECTALNGDGPRVKVGDVITVICHGASNGGRIVQPTLPKIRTDKTAYECTIDQLDHVRINKEVV